MKTNKIKGKCKVCGENAVAYFEGKLVCNNCYERLKKKRDLKRTDDSWLNKFLEKTKDGRK
jgi:ribosomal protein L37E